MGLDESRELPTFDLERIEIESVGGPIAGIDEAGRGPWAGPVVAAAVILDPDNIPDGIADSKMLGPKAREVAFEAIMASAICVGVGIGDVGRIDRVNILNAALWAMARATAQLKLPPRLAFVDGDRLPKLPCAAKAIVRGDAKCMSIAAASIVAKVTRDRIMVELAPSHPNYGFEQHKGYGTPEHQHAIDRFGVTMHHRRSFRPVRVAMGFVEA